jgi:hypothetical protein
MNFGGVKAYLNINIPNLHIFLKLILILENLEDFPWFPLGISIFVFNSLYNALKKQNAPKQKKRFMDSRLRGNDSGGKNDNKDT